MLMMLMTLENLSNLIFGWLDGLSVWTDCLLDGLSVWLDDCWLDGLSVWLDDCWLDGLSVVWIVCLVG